MSASDPVADMLTKVRNAAMARHEKVDVPASKLKLEIVKILKEEIDYPDVSVIIPRRECMQTLGRKLKNKATK